MINVSTFHEDLLGLNAFAKRLEKFIKTEQDYVEGGLVISLSSKFGSGKTTFLQMWQSALKEVDESERELLVIPLNAWESDYNSDPLFAIVSALADAVQNNGKSANALLEAAKDFGWFATTIASQVTKQFTGIDPVAAGKVAEEKKAKRNEKMAADAFTLYEGRKGAMKALKIAIKQIVDSSTSRALFLVDELDRCRPDYAISYLETIKHIFDIKGAVFILAADRRQLENSARTAFGPQLDFEEYYRKFVHREVSLPPISNDGYKRLASKYVHYYLERKGSRFCFMKLDSNSVDSVSEFVGAIKLTPRQIQEVFRTLGHLLETSEKREGEIYWCLAAGSIAMAALKIGAPDIYEALGTQQLAVEDAADFLKKTLDDSAAGWWFTLFLTGGGLSVGGQESHADVVQKISGKFTYVSGNLDKWYRDWGRSSTSRFKQIHEKIQQISQWN